MFGNVSRVGSCVNDSRRSIFREICTANFPSQHLVTFQGRCRYGTATLTKCQVAMQMHVDKARYDSWCLELARIDSQLRAWPHVATLATWMPYQNKTTSLSTQSRHMSTVSWLIFLTKPEPDWFEATLSSSKIWPPHLAGHYSLFCISENIGLVDPDGWRFYHPVQW